MSEVPSTPQPVYPYGEPSVCGLIKQYPADFQVTERLGFEPAGQGEHLFLYVEKVMLTTHQLVSTLAAQVGIRPRDVGYSGLKDKSALTRQWLSLHLPGCRQMPRIENTDGFRLLQSAWHDKKLRVGSHRSNRFEIVVRDVSGNLDHLSERLDQLRRFGFANYFGEQRFGQQQDNVQQALRVLNNRHKSRRLSRSKKGLYLSALRSHLFNLILSERLAENAWKEPLPGDLWMLAGSHSVFSDPLNDEILQRYQAQDIHSAITLYGKGESRLNARAEQLEARILEENRLICDTLLQHGMKRSYRASRAIPSRLEATLDAEQKRINVQVELEKGVYLTTLLNHFVRISSPTPGEGRDK